MFAASGAPFSGCVFGDDESPSHGEIQSNIETETRVSIPTTGYCNLIQKHIGGFATGLANCLSRLIKLDGNEQHKLFLKLQACGGIIHAQNRVKRCSPFCAYSEPNSTKLQIKIKYFYGSPATHL